MAPPLRRAPWTQAAHCGDDIELVAQRQEAMAVATMPILEANPVGEVLFKAAAQFRSKRVYDTFGLYSNPWQSDRKAVLAIGDSFKRERTTMSSRLKDAALWQECSEAPAKAKAKGRAKARAKGKVKTAHK